MTSRWLWICYWMLLGIPTAALGLFHLMTRLHGCDIGWGTSDCPIYLFFLMYPAALGFLTAIPFIAIGAIWLVLEAIIRLKGKQ